MGKASYNKGFDTEWQVESRHPSNVCWGSDRGFMIFVLYKS